MADCTLKGNCAPLPLSALRLLVPPIRLVSAAIWQTVQQRVVADYGMLEEFVSMVTDLVPELLTSSQRAQLTLGLRARLILELCQSEATSEFGIVQPHLDRMHVLTEAWVTETGAAGTDKQPDSTFVDLVKNLLKNPEEREQFFQEVFVKEFGPAYDEALHTLTWLFLSRLEKFLPLQTFQQVASMFGEASSVLGSCIESVSHCEELKTLLQYQKDLQQLDHNDVSVNGSCITSALRLPSVDATMTEKPQSQTHSLHDALSGPSLPLSVLRLLVPPIRLVSAAIWQTVEQKIVSDYGLLEEFVFMVTEIVPQLLSTRQRAELILGLRARLILELCRSEETADLKIIQPHLDRMQNLRSLWNVEADNAEQDVSDSHFMRLVQNVLRDSEERKNFFQDVFPGDFGPTYDKAIQTLMWLFLSRLEKLLPTQTLQQIASLLSDTSSTLTECMGSFSEPEELKILLDTHKDLNQLEDIDSYIVDSGILSALCLPPVERVVIVNEQTETEAESGLVYTVCTEMEVESENKEVYMEGTGDSEPCVQPQWLGLGSEVKAEADAAAATEGTGECEMAEDNHDGQAETLIIGEDGQVTVLDGVEKKTPNRRGRKKKRHADEDFDAQTGAGDQETDPEFDIAMWERPVRKNRGLKMKRYLSQWRKSGKTPGTNSNSGPKKFAGSQASAKNKDLEERTCKVCGKVVAHAKFLERHMNRHSEELSYSCTECKRFYKSLRYLQQHKCQTPTKDKDGRKEKELEETTADEGEQSSSGVLCDQDYVTSAEKRAKESEEGSPEGDKSLLDTGPFYCPHCSVEFKCRQTFRFHLRNICYNEQQVDPEQPEDEKHCFKCDECDKAFKYKSTLDSHKQTHNPLYCEVCMKLVRDSEALAMHKESHTPFQCNQCEENFPVFKALHKHYIDTHNPTEPFTCTHCQTTFASLKRFIRHEWKHTGYQPFQCTSCTKRFRSYSDLVEHHKKHTKAYPFLCWECGKKFRHGVTLTRHVERVHHSGEPVTEKPTPTFTCLQCGKTFTSRRCLLKHDNFHHKGLRFPCEHCGKGFFGKDALVRHTLIHTGERPFKCEDCEKSFRSAAELKIHRRYHTGERPYKCNVCEKGFVQSCFLTLHMRTHTGERPYVCGVCSKGFSSLHGLKRHRRLVHS